MRHLDTCTHCEMLQWANISCLSNIHYSFMVKSFRFLIALEIWLSSIVTGCVITHHSLLLLLCRILEYFNQTLHIYSTIHMNFLPFVMEFFSQVTLYQNLFISHMNGMFQYINQFQSQLHFDQKNSIWHCVMACISINSQTYILALQIVLLWYNCRSTTQFS